MPASLVWLHSDRRAVLSSAVDANTPAWRAHLLAAVARETDPAGSSEMSRHGDGAVQLALRGLTRGDAALAASAVNLWLGGLDGIEKNNDLGKAHLALDAAILYDAASALWPAETLAAWQRGVLRLISAFFTISPGNPHHIVNNWWAVTHSGLYCAVVALRDSGIDAAVPATGRTLAQIESWAWGRLDAFLGHFGETGAYHEGLGYQDYTCCYLLAAARLHENRVGTALANRFPGLARMAALIFSTGIEGPARNDSTGVRAGWGRQLSWNDAGLGWPDSATPLLALGWAEPAFQPALRDRWDRLSGHLRPDGHSSSRFGALFFQLALYPELSAPSATAAPLPLSVCDRRQGFWFTRDAYAGPADVVLGAYARCTHPGGHSQHDAGSFRFSALGWDWVLGGGQARPEAGWQSVVTSSGEQSKKAPTGSVLWAGERVFGMELRSVHQGYGERYLAFHPAGPAAVALLDLIDDHRDDREWRWNLTFSPELTCTFTPGGFVLLAPDGARLIASFLGDQPVSFELAHSPSSRRTFANGNIVDYSSRPCVVARCPLRSSLALYVVLTVHAPGADLPPATLIPGQGLSVAWGDQVWSQPFGDALPATATPALLRCQSPYPAPLSQ